MKTLFTLIFSALVPFTFFSQEYSWLDQSFAVDGYAHQSSEYGPNQIIDFEIDGNGSIISIFLGMNGLNYEICKLKANGLPDNTFGNGGKVIASLDVEGQNMISSAVLTLDKTGRILVGGKSFFNGSEGLFVGVFVQRFLPTGELDSSFGTDGTVFSSIAGAEEYYVMDIQTNETGKIVVGGAVNLFSDTLVWPLVSVLWSFDVDGLPIESFGTDGILIINDETQAIHSLAFDENGDILILFSWRDFDLDGTPYLSIVKRVFADGSFDDNFGNSNGLPEFNPYPALTPIKYAIPRKIKVNSAGEIFVLSNFLINICNSFEFIHPIIYGLDQSGNPLPDIPNGIELTLQGTQQCWVADFAFLGDDKIAFSGYEGIHPIYASSSEAFPYNYSVIGVIHKDGSIVEDFGENGIILTDTGDEYADIYTSVRIQNEDKIIAAGCSEGNGLVGRYTLEGYVSTAELTSSNVSIYPNPADDFIVVQMNDKRATGEIELFALDGRLMMSQKVLNENTVYLNVDHLESGIYILKYGNCVQRIEVL